MLPFEIPYLVLIGLLSIYGAHRLWLALEAAWRSRLPETPRRTLTPELAAARVLVQLPVYNDGEVFLRLLDSIERLEWDRGRLEVQVLDDSDDGSSDAIAARVAELRSRGLAIEHLRRGDRTGYKAGALAAGLLTSDAPYVALFDSDFVVPPDFLRRTLPEFADGRVAFVQGRWAYLNEGRSNLTRIQALMLDGHFAIEHRTRARANRFFNFNGTAGIWRRAAIDEAGGWRADTITEDLDLSLRAWFEGWRFVYRDDIAVPSELPERMSAYRTQQNRWIAGTMQTASAILPRLLSAPMSLPRRLDLFLGLTGNLCYPLIVLLAFALPHAIAIRLARRDELLLYADIPFFFFATGSVAFFYWRARRHRRGVDTLIRIPALMALGLGMTLHNSRAVIRGLTGRARVFERTPKRGEGRPRRRRDVLPWVEVAMFLYLVTIGLYAAGVALYSLPLVGLLAVGYGMVIAARREPPRPPAEPDRTACRTPVGAVRCAASPGVEGSLDRPVDPHVVGRAVGRGEADPRTPGAGPEERGVPGEDEAAAAESWIVTIDGPAGCGKSTVVRLLAERLGALAFSSGLVYRAVTWLALDRGIDPADAAAVRAALESATVEIVERDGALRVRVDGRDPGDELHGSLVTESIHWIADDPGLREFLLPLQRRLPEGRLILAEGRDLGTVVFPGAPVKVFLTASLEERARRRHAELRDRLGESISLDEVVEQVRRRDENDTNREVAPLRAAPDARMVDSTDRTPGEVAEVILEGVPAAWIPRGRNPDQGASPGGDRGSSSSSG